MDHLASLESSTCVLDAIFHLLALDLLLCMDIVFSCFVQIGITHDVDTVESLDASLQLLVIVQMIVEDIIDIVLKLLLLILLLTNFV